MKASANRFISLYENDFALAGSIFKFNTQQSTTGSDTRYNSSPHVQKYGTNFDNDDRNDTTLSISQSIGDTNNELHRQQQKVVTQTGVGQGNVIAPPFFAYIGCKMYRLQEEADVTTGE